MNYSSSSSILLALSSSSSPPQVLMERLVPITTTKYGRSPDDQQLLPPTCIAKVTLDRPTKANAMGKQMISDLNECLDVLETCSPSDCRCVILTSSSPKVFSAGADLKERATMNEEKTQEFVSLLRTTMQRVADLPMPVIASIDGVALGGGLELALAADLRIVSSRAQLGLPETSLAIVPGAGGTQRLPRLIGSAKAKELIWTARRLNAKQALECGLVNEIATDTSSSSTTTTSSSSVSAVAAAATERAIQVASEICSHGPVAIRASKIAIRDGAELECMQAALEIEKESYAKVIPTKDRLEGLQAFREGRKPSYTGE